MTTLADEEESAVNPVHLLLVGPSKVGKTDYIADLVLDGFTVLYIDADNGKLTLKKRLAHDPKALARCHYIRTETLYAFLVAFFNRPVLKWNETKDSVFVASKADPDDRITTVSHRNIPKGVVVVGDSWTSASLELLHDSAARNGVSFETFNDGGLSAYGDANRRANLLCSSIQKAPFDMIIQAHPEHYDRMEKPKGANAPKAKDMIIKENLLIPSSVSRPHGYSMSKYFNEVGWMRVDRAGKFVLDFKQEWDRVGGGSAMAIDDPKGKFRFSSLFAKPQEIAEGWITTESAAGLIEQAKAELDARLASRAAKKSDSVATPSNGGKPANPFPGLKPAGKI